MSRSPRVLVRIIATLVVVLSLGAAARAQDRSPDTGRAPSGRPSVVLILTDDQRWDSLWAMPAVRDLLIAHGVRFKNGYVVNPLCCPSRTSILTGQYSHSTGVYSNGPPLGGFSVFHDASTVATWLDADGYTTALIGKYLNGYTSRKAGTYIPPGWDRWMAFSRMQKGGGAYFNYEMNVGGALQEYGNTPQEYSTDVLADDATEFIRSTPGPLFLYFAPSAPHYPAIPAPRHRTAFSDLAPWRPPSYDEADVSDKPGWVQALPPLTADRTAQIDGFRLRQYRSLLAVDDAVRRIVRSLRQTGRLGNTMIVFASDNGYLWGEHRWSAKLVPYEESVRVPIVIRYDPLTAGPRSDAHLALNIDFAPTFADLAGTSAPGAEGTSLLPLLARSSAAWRTDFLIEHAGGPVPAYCGVHARRAVYVKYSTGEEELYRLRLDPYELQNRVTDPGSAGTLAALRARLKVLCQPPTPGVSP
jgi:arylsulfatase A-like enzyme